MNVDQYHEFGRTGLFDPTRRLELLEGLIYELHPDPAQFENTYGPNSHEGCISFLTTALMQTLGDRFTVFVQSSVRLSELTALRPDVMLLERRDDFYRHALPGAEDVSLVIEVSNGSLEFDVQMKLPFYAMAGIAEVWLVNLPGQQVELFAEPAGISFTDRKIFTRDTSVTSRAVPGLTLAVEEILG